MGIQIAVHLPPELVKSLDALVASGGAQSRASVIEQALTRELRYRRTVQEVEILNSGGGADLDLDSLTRTVSSTALDID
ncbi:MAG: ribbon-helix-helix domain-containing protein [Candidatus Nanopelagicales bacterium]|nr:ribbon-helix-helix domain-containing protein [Candidatus Nanopelagicales bacterium]MCF8539687.1 ribbon-helix-helix domain-containing protein [Candidatus Nanopelagicales bacterium]MCF8550862.1 ribbon-helix-helix domain-containing protein [Candidatus Nanopelagicales bacterium]